MRISHYELLQDIYNYQNSAIRMMEHQINKNLLKTCYKHQWIEKLDDDSVLVTDKGIEDAKSFMGSFR